MKFKSLMSPRFLVRIIVDQWDTPLQVCFDDITHVDAIPHIPRDKVAHQLQKYESDDSKRTVPNFP